MTNHKSVILSESQIALMVASEAAVDAAMDNYRDAKKDLSAATKRLRAACIKSPDEDMTAAAA